MRFRFLGDGDCPDWLLAEINALSRMTSIKMKILAQLVAKSITDQELDEVRVKKLTQDAKLESEDAKAIVAALELILTSSARYGVTPADLSNELQQLGLPREHSAALARIHTDVSSRIVSEALIPQSLRRSRVSSVEIKQTGEDFSPFCRISLNLKKLGSSKEAEEVIDVAKDDIPVLLAELKKVRAMMEGI
ncbi:COMM domain-containing protein 4 [Venturia canescens]|uniref:COMM domain-containing protein 4 n=1 Tax=Venturia canescens TaxID=32260 RepID=UPI001C9BF85A|nr:COMM domain-containing protein 4 [Venturia canescens]